VNSSKTDHHFSVYCGKPIVIHVSYCMIAKNWGGGVVAEIFTLDDNGSVVVNSS